ncbi:MAG: tRNA (adenosine(37)-N6)-dimethylallyltransferase MiaA [Bacteroidales bacterium]
MHILKVLEGPTGVGKTALAIQWALESGTEILSADSRQFYQELNIGVARPSVVELKTVPHHFIAFKSIHHPYSVSQFEMDALTLLDTLFQRHNEVILVGGSGLYINALCYGIDDLPDPDPKLREELKLQLQEKGISYLQQQLKIVDPDFYQEIDLCNSVRLRRALEVCFTTGKPYSSLRTHSKKHRPFEIQRYALNRPKDILQKRINQRVDIMMQDGLLEEAHNLLPYANLNALQTVGYRELFSFFKGEISYERAVEDIKTHSRRYAKRQLTWLRKQENLQWIEA